MGAGVSRRTVLVGAAAIAVIGAAALGRYDEAVAPLEKAVSLAPNRYLYWGNLADAYRWSSGQKAKAGDAYARAIDMVRAYLAKKPDDAPPVSG